MRRSLARCASAHAETSAPHPLITALAAAPPPRTSPRSRPGRSSPPTPRGPRPSPPRPTPSPPRRPARSSPSAASPRSSRARTAPTWRCPTTASAASATRTRSCSASTRSDTARGDARILGAINLRDPTTGSRSRSSMRAPGALPDRRRLRHRVVPHRPRGTLWFGDEFGPFLLHTDAHRQGARGADPAARRALARLPASRPARREPRLLQRLRGHGDLARRPTLYPTLEGPLADDADKTIRRSYTFDIAERRYERLPRLPRRRPELPRLRPHRAGSKRFVSLERDNFQGPAAVHKQAFVVTPARRALERAGARRAEHRRPAGDLAPRPGAPRRLRARRPVPDALPDDRGGPAVGGTQLAIVNDTNFGSTGRNAALPDYSDFIRVQVPAIARR
jgi:hypothetical protein